MLCRSKPVLALRVDSPEGFCWLSSAITHITAGFSSSPFWAETGLDACGAVSLGSGFVAMAVRGLTDEVLVVSG